MFCKKCGAALTAGDAFCVKCGATVEQTEATNNNGGAPATNNAVVNNTPVNNTPVNNVNNGGNNGGNKMLIIGIGIAILVALIVLIVVVLVNGGNDSDKLVKNEEVVADVTPTYTVNFNNFKFKIPTDLIYETTSDSILLSDDVTWGAEIYVMDGSFASVKENKNQLVPSAQTMGMNAKLVEKKVSGKEFLLLEASKGSEKAMIGYTDLSATQIGGFTIYNVDNEFDYDAFDIVAKVLASAEYVSETSNMDKSLDIDLKGIASLK